MQPRFVLYTNYSSFHPVSLPKMFNLMPVYLAVKWRKERIKMPTTEAFWNQMAAYNTATLPVQIVFYIAAGILTFLVFTRYRDKVNMYMKMLLAFAFGWNGVVFFMIYSKSPLTTFFGAPLFLLIAILSVVDIFVNNNHFRLPEAGWQRYAAIF